MYLSQFANKFNSLEIYHDGEFEAFEVLGSKSSQGKKLFFCENNSYVNRILRRSDLSAIITTKDLVDKFSSFNIGILVTSNPRETFFKLHNLLVSEIAFYETEVPKCLTIGLNSNISPIGVVIGKNCTIGNNVKILPGVTIGDNVKIECNSRIGNNPFYFFKEGENSKRVAPAGNLVIGNDVEIGLNCIIEKAVYHGSTKIGNNSKLGANVLVAHDAMIGENCIILNGVSIGARVIVEEGSWLGINSTIANSVKIGPKTRVNIESLVVNDLEPNSIVSGHYAIDHMKFIANQIKLNRKMNE